MPFCSACGVEGEGDFCSACGKPRALPRSPSAETDTLALQIRSVNERLRTERYVFPAVLSFFIPGLGQIVKGRILLGALIMFGSLFAAGLCAFGIGFVALPVLWIFQLYEAYTKPDAALSDEAERLQRSEHIARFSGTSRQGS